MSTTLRGNAVVTTNRDPNKNYVSDRSLSNLEKLGVTGDTLTVAKRGDQILDPTGSMPGTPAADGVLRLFELDRLDEPQNRAVLFPGEQAAVPAVHQLFEIPNATPATIAPLDTLAYKLDRKLTSPAVTSAQISNLPTPELQTAARRLQMVRNSDGDAGTITRDDIQWALQPANVGAFTPATVAELNKILATFHDDVFAEKVIGVLPRNSQDRELVSAGGVKVSLRSTVGFHTLRPSPDDGRHYRWQPAVASQGISVEAPVGYKVFVKLVATDPAQADPGNAEAVVEGNGGSQTTFTASFAGNNASVWVQIMDPIGAMVRNVRVAVPPVTLPPMQIAPGLSGRRVEVWQDENGNVIDQHANGDRGISGYSLDGHSHLFARDAVIV